MSRPADWFPLAEGDPVPGDPSEVAALGIRFRDTVTEIDSLVKRLRSMCVDDFWDSGAGLAFKQRADATAGEVSKARAGYESAMLALGTSTHLGDASTQRNPQYASALAYAQQESAAALAMAQDAVATQQDTLSQLGSSIGSSSTGVPGRPTLGLPPWNPWGVTPGTPEQIRFLGTDTPQVASLKRQYNSAADDISAAQAQLKRAESARDEAATSAAAMLSSAIRHGDLADAAWLAHVAPATMAAAFKAAIVLKDHAARQRGLALIAKDLATHDGDKAFLEAFWNTHGVAADAANLAMLLHANAAPWQVLPSDGFRILRGFATSLAAADKAGLLSPKAVKAIVGDRNVWSMGMLFMAGPPGDKKHPAGTMWGAQETKGGPPNLLAQATTAVEMARLHDGYVIPITLPSGSAVTPWDTTLTSLLKKYDPAQTMLELAAGNGAAAREVLAGRPDGQEIARALMLSQDAIPQPVFDSSRDRVVGVRMVAGPPQHVTGQHVPSGAPAPPAIRPADIGWFFTAATGAARGAGAAARDSAHAAIHLIDATPSPTGPAGITVPEPIRQALVNAYGNYQPDLAASVYSPAPLTPVIPPEGAGGMYLISVDSQHVSAFLQQICVMHTDYANIQNTAGLAIGASLGHLTRGVAPPPGLPAPVNAYSELYGRISAEASNVGINHAQQVDLRNQHLNTVISMAENAFYELPGPEGAVGKALSTSQVLGGLVFPNLGYSTDNASNAIASATTTFGKNQAAVAIPIVKELSRTGALSDPLPAGAFDSHGNPTTALGDWWRGALPSQQAISNKHRGPEQIIGPPGLRYPLAQWLTIIESEMQPQQNAYGTH